MKIIIQKAGRSNWRASKKVKLSKNTNSCDETTLKKIPLMNKTLKTHQVACGEPVQPK